MAVTATYTLYVDWASDGSWATGGDDISADWIGITIKRGYSSPLARYPFVGRMTVRLRNAAKTYSPPETAAARPRRPVKLDMTYGGNTVTMFRGWIETLRPAFGTTRSRQAVMECVDAIALLDRYDGEIALQTNTYADDIITSVVAATYTPPATNYQSGINMFPTAADRWTGRLLAWEGYGGGAGSGVLQRVNAANKIQDACAGDWGRFFISKAGAPTYYNRHQMPFDTSTALTLDDDIVGMDYEMGVSDIYNTIEVTCHPRKIGEVNEVLGEMDQNHAVMIEASGAEVFDIQFRDPSNNAIQLGGKTVVTPVRTTDFTVTSDEAGEGDDETLNVTATMAAYGDHATITITNDVARIVWLQPTLQVRGLAVRSLEPVTVLKEDVTSQGLYEKRRLRIDASLMSNPIHAENLAEWLLAYYKDPMHDIRGVTIFGNTNATFMAAVMNLELMARVVLTETQTGLSAQATYIYSMQHQISRGSIHTLTLDLEIAKTYTARGIWNTSLWQGTDKWVY